MGVLGLTPFLHKTCPEVIKQLPERLRGLAGKTIVIDGTLITQRLHFAPVPHRFRHVLGWYRLVKELKDCGVGAICVFDGKERSLAKAREVERRKQIQRMTATRGFIEVNRLKRLRKLVGLFEEFRSLPGSEQERVTSLLRQMVSDKDIFSTRSSSNWCLENNLKHIERLINLSDGNAQAVDHYIDDLGDHLPPTGNDAEFFLSSKGYINFSSAAPKSSSDGLQQSSRQPNENSRPRSIIHDPPPACFPEIQPNMTSEYVPSTLTSLYLEYCRSIPQLASLSTPYHDSVPSDPDDASTEYAMTKSQYQLTLDEGKFWERLAGLTEARQDQSITEATLMSLTEKSSLMSDSYQRRSNPPTTQTYNESKEILQAMGVPCLDCGGPFEAEALASSLVINGLADYVASEDTDVLIYEAPMIRNITNRQGPLVIVSGAEIRTVLQLDRARYVDFALLLGTDFSQRIKNVGPTRALKFIREYGSIERVLELEPKYSPRVSAQVYLEQVEVARLVFGTLPPVPDTNLLQPGENDENAIQSILERHRLHRLAGYDLDYSSALDGNYFEDNPSAF